MTNKTRGSTVARSIHRRVLAFLNSAARAADLMHVPRDILDPRADPSNNRRTDAPREHRFDREGRRLLFDEATARRILEIRDSIGPFGFVSVDQLGEIQGVADNDIDELIETFGPEAMGQWQILPYNIPIPGLADPSVAHAALLRTGEVLFIPEHPDATNYPTPIWDSSDESVAKFTFPVTNPLYSLFCGGHSFLSDGRLFVAGGGGNSSNSFATRGHIFDPASRTWTATPQEMNHARWYPTVLTLGDYRVLVTCGNGSGNMQVYAEKTAAFEDIEGDTEDFPHLYPGLHLLPHHRIFYSRTGWGSSGSDAVGAHEESGYFEFDAPVAGSHTGRWEDIQHAVSQTHRAKGMSVTLLQPLPQAPGQENQPLEYGARVLVLGGAHGDPTYEVINVTSLSPASAWDGAMPVGESRRHCNAVLLPDGAVFVSGGGLQVAPIPSALFDPVSNSWSQMSTPVSPKTRSYHGVSLLLPNGKVMAGGSQSSAIELFSPPYLFKGPRPVIRDCPAELVHGMTFKVRTPDGPHITSVVLVRPMAVTHQTDTEQRVIQMKFGRDPDTDELIVTSPSAEYPHSLAPPGYYMLFILNSRGIPSVASWVRLVSPTVLVVPDRTPIVSHKRNDDHMEVWVIDAYGVVRGNYWDGEWHDWYSLHNPATLFPQRGYIAAVGRNDDHMEIFAVGSDGQLHHNWWNGEWRGWKSLGTPSVPGLPPGAPALFPGSPLTAQSRFANHMEVWVVAADRQVHSIWWDGNQWSGWNPMAGAVFPAGAPLASHCRNDNHMEVWGIDTDGTLRGNWWDGGWHNWYPLPPRPGAFRLNPGGHLAALGRNDDRMEVWTIGTDDKLHGIWWNGNWESWYTLDGPFSFPPGGPLAAVSRNDDYMEVWAAGDDNKLHGIWWNGGWRDWYSLDTVVVPRSTPPAALSRNDDHMEVWAVAPTDLAQTTFKVHGVYWDGNWSAFYRLE